MDLNRRLIRDLDGTQSEIEIKLIDFGYYFSYRDFDRHGFFPLLLGRNAKRLLGPRYSTQTP